jgi:uncharacterized BrkB/YihY/UPF0761 family membrane protein
MDPRQMSPARCRSGVLHGILVSASGAGAPGGIRNNLRWHDHARQKLTEQLQYLIDPSGIKVIQDIAANASKPQAGFIATTIGLVLALFGACGVFGQLQDALNTIWGVTPKPSVG